MKTVIVAALASVIFVTPSRSAEVVLYQSNGVTAPNAQGQLFFASDTTQTAVAVGANGTTFDTTANSGTRAGYSNRTPFIPSPFVNPFFPTLDRVAGFTIRLDLKVNSESHSSADRAGFSLIALASDLRGVEIGFWQDQIWVQNDTPLFTHGDSALFNTTASTQYDLKILGNNFALIGNGTSLLTGSLRDYSAAPDPPELFSNPYELGSYLFIGDDTTSASANVEIARLSVVPEPTVMGLLAGAFGSLARRRCRVA